MSVYNNSIPNATDFLSDSQQDIKNNFQQLDTTFGLNHFQFSDGTANNGKHSYIEMVNEAALPVGLADEEGTVYTKKVDTHSEMFYSTDDTGREFQITKFVPDTVTGANGTSSVTRFTFLPGNIIYITGTKTNGQDGSTINFTQALDSVIAIHLTPLGSSTEGGGTRCIVANPRSVNLAGATMVINLRDTNNREISANRTVYFSILGTTPP